MTAVTFRKIKPVGFGDHVRYEVSFLGEKIGEVYRYTRTEVVCTGGRRYGTSVDRERWGFDRVDGQSVDDYGLIHTRTEAMAELLVVKHYPGRKHIAERLAKKAESTR